MKKSQSFVICPICYGNLGVGDRATRNIMEFEHIKKEHPAQFRRAKRLAERIEEDSRELNDIVGAVLASRRRWFVK